MGIFVLTALAWILRSFILKEILPGIDDTQIAMIGALLMFLIPAKDKKPLINWKEAVKLPWGILLLFGGGMAIASGFEVSGLAKWIGNNLNAIKGLSLMLILFILVASVNFLTEITSNMATTAMLLPILVSMALVLDVHPYLLLVSATLAASCAFMLPVATPPNAVVFGSNLLEINDMVKKGFILNILSVIIISLVIYVILPFIWNLN